MVVAPDLVRGFPSDTATRSGRALAMQLLSVILARRNGFAADQVIVDALPAWIWDEPEPATQAIAAVAVRRAALPDHQLSFREPEQPSSRGANASPFVLGAALPFAAMSTARCAGSALVLRAPGAGVRERIVSGRVVARVANELADAMERPGLRGSALDQERAIVAAAESILQRLADEGWSAVLGQPLGGADRGRLGADAVVERSEAFDPFDRRLGANLGR